MTWLTVYECRGGKCDYENRETRGIETPNIPPNALNVFCHKMSTKSRGMIAIFWKTRVVFFSNHSIIVSLSIARNVTYQDFVRANNLF